MPRKTKAADRQSPEIGARLAQARKAKGYTQQQMADVFGITDVAWRSYEKGRELRSAMIVEICAILECSPNWLLGINDESMELEPEDPRLRQLKDIFMRLSTEGQKEALKRVQELADLPQYSATSPSETGADSSIPPILKVA